MLEVSSHVAFPASTLLAKGERLMRMNEVVERFAVHPNTLRRATDAGLLQCLRVNGLSHRRFREADILCWLGAGEQGNQSDDSEGNNGVVPVALVARVSSAGQARSRTATSDESDLSRQIERLTAYARERWGGRAKLHSYTRTASGMLFSHPTLLNLITDILSGKFRNGYIVATYPDRVLRFGTELFRAICEFGGATLVFTESASEQTDEESLCSDVLAVITHFSAKTHGKRSAKALRVKVAEETILQICRWSSEGHSNREIAKRLVREGRAKDERGRQITLRVVRRVLKENAATVATLNRHPDSPAQNSFGVFCSQRVRQTNEATRLLRKTLVAAYHHWCKGRNEVPLSDRAIGNYVRSHFPSVHQNQKHGHGGATIYLGLSLLPEG